MRKKIHFKSAQYILAGNLVYSESFTKSPAILICHGAGAANKQRFLELQNFLLDKGFVSLCFDFTGVGESQGKFEKGTLEKRLKDAQAALEVLKKEKNVDKKNIIVIGTSMGGHIACRLTEKNPDIKAVVLLYGAAYGKETEDKPLNEEFTRALRIPDSWKNSPAFSALEKYKGKVLIIYGTEDKIVPDGVKEMYSSLIKKRGSFFNLEGGGHLLLSVKTLQEEKVKSKVIELLLNFLDKVASQ